MMKKTKLSLIALALLTTTPLISLTGCASQGESEDSSGEVVTQKANVSISFNEDGGEAHIAKLDYKIGDKVSIKYSVKKGYSLAFVKVNEEKIRPNRGEYSFVIETSEVKIEVLFEKNKVLMSDFNFEFDHENHTATIVKYKPDSRIVPYPFVVPESVSYGDETFIIDSIKKEAFSSSYVEAIVLSKNIKNIELGTFSIVYGLTSIEVDPLNEVFASYDHCLYTKDFNKLIAVPIEYSNSTFKNKEGTKIIGEGAFINNRSIKLIDLTSSVTSLEPSCFMDMSSLENVNLSSNITQIPIKSFANDNSLRKIVIPEGISVIDEFAFNFCTELQEVIFPSTLKEIKKEAFYRCQKLKNPIFNEGLEVIGKSAFGSCISLTELKMPNSLITLGEAAFESCTSLKTCLLNEGLINLGGAAFILDVSLVEIVIPKSVSNVVYNPLIGCANATIKVKEGSQYYKVVDGVLYSSDMSKLICVPHGLKTSDNSFTIPNSVTHLITNAFSMNLYLKKVVIPTSVIYMHCAFQEILPNQVSHVYEMELNYLGTVKQFNEIDDGGIAWNYKANFKNNIVTCSNGTISLTPQLG